MTTATTNSKKKDPKEKEKAAATATTVKPNKTLTGLKSLVSQATKGALVPVQYKRGQVDHIPTGIPQIDTLIGGELTRDQKEMICPGLPKGRIIEVYGSESSGKTTLALSFAQEVQKKGGTVLFLDYEHALSVEYAESIGIAFNSETFHSYQPETFEEGVKAILLACREKVDLIIVDSVSAMIPASEIGKKVDDAAKIGVLAATMSKYLPRLNMRLDQSGTSLIFINQTRALISSNSYAGSEDNTSGGRALKFFCYLRIKTTRIRSDFVERKDTTTLKKKRMPYGNLTQIKMVKNKVSCTQGHSSEVFIRYGSGVDNYLSLIESAIPRKLIGKNGSTYTVAGQSFKGKERLRKYLIENPKLMDELRLKVMQAIVGEKTVSGEKMDEEIEDEDIVSDAREDAGDEDDDDSSVDALEQTLDEIEVEAS